MSNQILGIDPFAQVDHILRTIIAERSVVFYDDRDDSHRQLTSLEVVEIYTKIVNDLEKLKACLSKDNTSGLKFVDFSVPNNNPIYYEETADGIEMKLELKKEIDIPVLIDVEIPKPK